MRVRRLVLLALLTISVAAPGAAARSWRYELHLVNVDDASERTLVRSDGHEYTPLAFASATTMIVLRSGGGHDQVQRLSLDDARRTSLFAQRLPSGSDPLPA